MCPGPRPPHRLIYLQLSPYARQFFSGLLLLRRSISQTSPAAGGLPSPGGVASGIIAPCRIYRCAPALKVSPLTKHTILVVDDEPDVVKSVQDLLRLEYRVLGATRAAEGLQILQQEEVHVVMTDQRMPEMSGVEFLSRVRGEHPEAIRLLFTGYPDLTAVVGAINAGQVYRYITKPWDPDELLTIIREAVERYDLLVDRTRLTDELQSKNAQLEKANTELKHANALKTAFIQVASHELRTPLTILLGLTKLAIKLPADPVLHGSLGRIEHAAQRLQHLVDQLISMLLAGDYDRGLQRRPQDLAALLSEAADDVRPFIELRGQTLALDLPANLGVADVDASRIRDSVNHLLLNAIKFTPDHGRVGLHAAPGNDGDIQIRVSDTGAGIDPQWRQRLFEPFFTGFNVSKHSSGQYEHGRQGIGLGLAVVKRFIEMHGGHVEVESELGRGTTFTITLPRHANAELKPVTNP